MPEIKRHYQVYRLVHGWLLSGRQNGHLLLRAHEVEVLAEVLVLLQGDPQMLITRRDFEQRRNAMGQY